MQNYKVLFSGLSGGLSVMIPGVMIFAVICLNWAKSHSW